ncbi:MAG: TfoX/Sxy family protein [bacterium]
MSVSDEFLQYLLELLDFVPELRSRRMFGAVGFYGEGLFFALADDNVLYFKVDDSNRDDYLEAGMHPFQPVNDTKPMQYYEVPPEVLEDRGELRLWTRRSIAVARRKQK